MWQTLLLDRDGALRPFWRRALFRRKGTPRRWARRLVARADGALAAAFAATAAPAAAGLPPLRPVAHFGTADLDLPPDALKPVFLHAVAEIGRLHAAVARLEHEVALLRQGRATAPPTGPPTGPSGDTPHRDPAP
jgi:hypothetical protein